jgi:hypothetical protein
MAGLINLKITRRLLQRNRPEGDIPRSLGLLRIRSRPDPGTEASYFFMPVRIASLGSTQLADFRLDDDGKSFRPGIGSLRQSASGRKEINYGVDLCNSGRPIGSKTSRAESRSAGLNRHALREHRKRREQ